MYGDPKLFRQARTMLKASKRQVAEAVGEKESSIADIEAGRKKLRPELAYKLWSALWDMIKHKSPADPTVKIDAALVGLMYLASVGPKLGISPEKLLACQHGKEKLTPEEADRWDSYLREKSGSVTSKGEKPWPIPTVVAPPITFDQAGRMPIEEVMDSVWNEYAASPIFFLYSQTASPKERAAALVAYCDADPRVKFCMAHERIASLEEECDDLRRELLKANEELLEVYRRIAVLEKNDLERQKQ